jgi:phenylalanyl-tRNA synthetase beta chain
MPTIDISLKDLSHLVGEEITLDILDKEAILWVKGEIDGFDGKDIVKIDCKDSNRPDLWSTEGIARQIKPLFKDVRGIPAFNVEESDVYLHVDRSVDDVRPYITAAVVENIQITEDLLKQLIQLQEKVCMTFGRKRAVVAIGLYDFDKITPPLTYKAVKPTSAKFLPLDAEKEMTLKDILQKHPKGIEYKHLLKNANNYPIVVDSKDIILSMPPIINSQASGKVTEATTNLFVEVTGTDLEDAKVALRIICAALADRGGSLKSVTVDYGEEKLVTPDYTPKKMKVTFENIENITGMKFTLKEMKELYDQFSYNAKKSKVAIELEYPAYRQDILHYIDVIEDLLISYGYNSIEPVVPEIATVGDLDPLEEYSERVRNSLVGFGAQELLNFTLTNREILFTKMNVDEWDVVEIANPVSNRWTCIRNWVLPTLMAFFEQNRSVEYPQQVFEVGDVCLVDDTEETRTKTVRRLAWALADNNASFTRAKQILDYLLKGLGLEYQIVEVEHGSFIDGRCGRVIVNGVKVAYIGEIKPKVLHHFNVDFPVCAFELNISELFKLQNL